MQVAGYFDTKSEKDRYIQLCDVMPGAAPLFPELAYMISDSTRSGGIYSPSGAILNTSPKLCENVDVGSCTRCDGVRVRYTRSRASSAACQQGQVVSSKQEEDTHPILGHLERATKPFSQLIFSRKYAHDEDGGSRKTTGFTK